MFSHEYLLSIVLIIGGILKVFGIEIENDVIEGLIGGAIALYIAIRRKARGDINLIGAKI